MWFVANLTYLGTSDRSCSVCGTWHGDRRRVRGSLPSRCAGRVRDVWDLVRAKGVQRLGKAAQGQPRRRRRCDRRTRHGSVGAGLLLLAVAALCGHYLYRFWTWRTRRVIFLIFF
jgi:hypothetical protein